MGLIKSSKYSTLKNLICTYRVQVLLVLENCPDHGAEVDEEGYDDEHEDGHVVAEADGREDEVEVDRVRLRHEPGHEGGQVSCSGSGQGLGGVVDGDAGAFPDLSGRVQEIQADRVQLDGVVDSVELPVKLLNYIFETKM